MQKVITTLQEGLNKKGLDIVHPFSAQAYNNLFTHDKSKEHLLLPSFSEQNRLAVLVGNTKYLWNRFIESGRIAGSSPLDKYVESCVNDVVADISVPSVIRFGHHFSSKNQPQVSLQHAAHASQFAFYDNQISFLSYHPEYGPWFGLRCVIVFNIPFTDHELERTKLPFDQLPFSTEIQSEMKKCVRTAQTWQDWLKLRDIATQGMANSPSIIENWRYGPNQLHYHYTGNRKYLVLEH